MTVTNRTARIRRCAAFCALALVIAGSSVLAASVKTFNPKTYKGKMGRISLTYAGECRLGLKDRRNGKIMMYSSRNGVVQAPVGSYKALRYEAVARDGDGKWTAYCLTILQTPVIAVKANSTQKVALGPPFVASVDVSRTGRDSVSLGFNLAGAGGHRYIIVKGDRNLEPPGFEMYDTSGRIVWQGNFKYG